MWKPILAIAFGGSLGAVLRWWLGLALNAYFPAIPPGTLAANLIGGYLIGVALEFFLQHALLPAEWRLFVITGFLGGLTTFSTFSGEAVELLIEQRYGWAVMLIGSHLLGSLAMTVLGLHTMRWLTA